MMDAYDFVAETIFDAEKKRLGEGTIEVYDTWIVRVKTDTNGIDNVLLTRDEENPDGLFEYDWYEGGDVKILGYVRLDDVFVPTCPDADVVEVVRCKDCRYWENRFGVMVCNLTDGRSR